MQGYSRGDPEAAGYQPVNPGPVDQSHTGFVGEAGSQYPSAPPPMYSEKVNMQQQQQHDGNNYQPGPGAPPGYTIVGPGHTSVGGPYAPPPPPGCYPMAGQQPMAYGMSADNPQAFIYVQPAPLTNPPNDYMAYSLFATICCCWIIGLFAIMRASECRVAIQAGNRPEAVLKSNQARKYSHIAVGLGIVSILMVVVIFGIYYGMLMKQIYN